MSDKHKEIVKMINSSFLKGDSEGFLSFCAEDVIWTMVGEKRVAGKAEIREWMTEMDGMAPPEFNVKALVADGITVVCTGDMKMKDHEGKTSEFGYCDIYTFAGDKVSELTSFVVKTKLDEAETTAS